MDEPRYSHVLVVGGTGMLRRAAQALAGQARKITVLGRSLDRLRATATADNVGGLPVDYRDAAALAAACDTAVEWGGPIDLVVAWIHEDAPRALDVIAARLGPAAFYHVLGSAHDDLTGPDRGHRATYARYPSVTFREVVLGYVAGPGGSRWLTHDEISGGVLEAVAAGRPRTIVGQTRPWADRP